MRLSVVVCTHRRPHLVAGLLDALARAWDHVDDELVVVDDTPADRRVAAACACAPLPVTYLEVDGPGLSAARNHGWQVASGSVVVFLDDDSRPTPPTLAAYRRAFGADEALAAAGGPVVLRWPASPPRWYSPALAGYYSGIERGAGSPSTPFGANMAVRRAVLAAHGGFAEGLGRHGRSLLSGEETDLFARIVDGGGRLGWVPDAVVHHEVAPERTRRRWLARRAFAQGRTDIRIAQRRGEGYRARPALAATAGVAVRGWREVASSLGAPDRDAVVAQDLARRARAAGRLLELAAPRPAARA